MKTIRLLSGAFLCWLLLACNASKNAGGGQNDAIDVVFLQLNDVYEISPSSSDDRGGMARVAQLRKELLAKNPNVITVLSGDFISPSVIGTLKYEGKRIRGKQMVETMNALGVDWVVFGNHEFDYDDLNDLQARMDESNFNWLGGNVRLKGTDGSVQPFFKNKNGQKVPVQDDAVVTVKDADGTTINIGLFGVLFNSGRKPWAQYSDWSEAAQRSYNNLKLKSDVVVGITHLPVDEDKKLLAALPGVPLIMGGHEHENMLHRVGTGVVAKADANAKTVYVHTLHYNKKTKKVLVKSELRKIDNTLTEEPQTAAVVAKWEKIKNESLTTSGFDANKKVTDLKEPLDCRETTVRMQPAPVGSLIGKAMIAAGKNKPECALFNGGSIRVDDILTGTLTELDIVRMLPFGGPVYDVEMKGSLLRKTLDTGMGNVGNGGFLQWENIKQDAAKKWLINNQPLNDTRVYRIMITDFLLTGNEQNMSFLKATANTDGTSSNPEIVSIKKPNPSDKSDLRNDIRLLLIDYMRK